MSEIVNETEQIVQYQNPSALLALAIQKDVDIDRLAKLMELQERWQANEAKKSFVVAMTEFKQNPPQIIKDMHVEFSTSRGKTSYNHASLGNITAATTESLSKHGLSTRWETEQKEKSITVTCIITHKDGHSEKAVITASPDDSGGKNAIQAIGSTITYLQRYTLLAITGLATNEFEDDGRGAGTSSKAEKPKSEKKSPIPKTQSPAKEEIPLTLESYLMKTANAKKWLFDKTKSDDSYFAVLKKHGYRDANNVNSDKAMQEIINDLKAEMVKTKENSHATKQF